MGKNWAIWNLDEDKMDEIWEWIETSLYGKVKLTTSEKEKVATLFKDWAQWRLNKWRPALEETMWEVIRNRSQKGEPRRWRV